MEYLTEVFDNPLSFEIMARETAITLMMCGIMIIAALIDLRPGYCPELLIR